MISFTRRLGSARPLQTSLREEHHIVRNSRVQPTASSAAIQEQTPTHPCLRLKWFRARGNWTTAEWNQVVFSDVCVCVCESGFNPSSDDNRVRVWRHRGLNPAFALKLHTAPTDGVMVWGAIAYNTRSPQVLIRGTMTAQRYVHDILQPHVLPLIQRLAGALFQQVNAWPHTARVSQDYLCTVTTLSWPARSPDLSHVIICDGKLGIPRDCMNERQGYNKYGTKCLKAWYRTCIPQCPIVHSG
ncbi:transposable element Tcb2 transposase [Trichonephila clavipes]|nr:transposable element Tcb2 transposase [Trichonephila clavipes]